MQVLSVRFAAQILRRYKQGNKALERGSLCFFLRFAIKIITEWHVSIRPCELNNFAELLNVKLSVSRGLNEYKLVMNYLEENAATLVDIIDCDQREYLKTQIYTLKH